MTNFYLLKSRLATHLSFWVIYYITFSLIWAKSGDFFSSFYLEFVLLPVRIFAVYTTIYILIPRFLKYKKYLKFSSTLLALLITSALLQRTIIFFFFDRFILDQPYDFYDIGEMLRSMILINSTVLFVSSIKIFKLWQEERDKNHRLLEKQDSQNHVIKIKSEKRVFRIPSNEILFIEGLGNYVIYHTTDQKLISYISLKDALKQLPGNFIRIHKSYVINKEQIRSYDPESVEINEVMIPVGKSFKGDLAI